MKHPKQQLDIAFKIAKRAHKGQFRRDGATPYIDHCIDVHNRVYKLGWKHGVVALLHDVLEYSTYTPFDIYNSGINKELVDIVIMLTKPIKSPYENPYEEYIKFVRTHPIAKDVKLQDMISNLNDTLTPTSILKYANGLQILLDNPQNSDTLYPDSYESTINTKYEI